MRKRKLEMSSRFVAAVLCLAVISAQALRGEPAAPPEPQTADPATPSADSSQASTDTSAQSIELLGANASNVDRRDWRGTIGSTVKFLMAEHAGRILFQEKTRRELGGNFWLDYEHSVHLPRQWGDGDSWGTNYVGHPIHGATAGDIWLAYGPGRKVAFDPRGPGLATWKYWQSHLAAAGYAAVFSLQFEVGPFSEASIGNVGLNSATAGWVDHVVTPLGALGWMAAEDTLDRYVVQWIESKAPQAWVRIAVRSVLTPAASLANASRGEWPWTRPGRPLHGR
jgi:hypothetical protein